MNTLAGHHHGTVLVRLILSCRHVYHQPRLLREPDEVGITVLTTVFLQPGKGHVLASRITRYLDEVSVR